MLSALPVILSAVLALGLVALAVVCVVLWRRVHALSAIVERPSDRPPTFGPITVAIEPPAPAPPASRVVAPSRPRPPSSPTPTATVRVDRAEKAGPTLISVPNLAASAAPGSETASEMDRRFGDVWGLADAGTPVATIASRTGYPIGQVELILGLRRRLPATSGAASDA